MSCAAPSTTAYDLIGGEPGIDAFVSRLYDIMASKPEAEYIWKWHPQDMDEVKARLAAILSGWLGGPVVYPQNYGPPMMPGGICRFLLDQRSVTFGSIARGRHLPIPCRMWLCGSFSTRR